MLSNFNPTDARLLDEKYPLQACGLGFGSQVLEFEGAIWILQGFRQPYSRGFQGILGDYLP